MPDQPPIPAMPTIDPAVARLHLPAVIDRRSDAEALALRHLVCAWVAEAPRQPPAQEERAEGEGHAHAGGTVLYIVWIRRVGGGATPLSQRSGHGVPPPVRKRVGAVQSNTCQIKQVTGDIDRVIRSWRAQIVTTFRPSWITQCASLSVPSTP
jgi:hypothetical protein